MVVSLLKHSSRNDIDKKAPSTGQTPLYVAVQHGHTDVTLALARGEGDLRLADSRGWSPLIRAAFDGRAKLVTELLVCGSQVDAKDKEGDQALHYAVRLGHLDVVRVLLQAKADPCTRGKVSSPATCRVGRSRCCRR